MTVSIFIRSLHYRYKGSHQQNLFVLVENMKLSQITEPIIN